MTDLELFLIHLRCMDVYLWIDGAELRFRAPKGRLASDLVERIRGHRDELIAILERPPFVPPSTADGLVPFDGSMNCVQTHMLGYYPHLQRPDFLHPSSIWSWRGQLNVDMLSQALQLLVSRHSALRSYFQVDRAHQYRMVVAEPFETRIDFHDVEDTAPAKQEAAARRIVQSFVGKRLDVCSPPLFGVCVVRLSSEHHIVALVVHHAITDAFSSAVIAEELSALYFGLSTGKMPNLPPAGIGFPEIVRRQNEWLASRQAAEQLEYWEHVFRGARKPFWLPHDVMDPADASTADPGPVCGTLARALVTSMECLCEEHNMPLHAAITAAFVLAIARWRNEIDVCMWVISHGRHTPAHYGQVGCFADSWALRASFGHGTSFVDAMKIVAAIIFAATPNTAIPSQQVAQAIGSMCGSLDRATIFNYLGSGTFGTAGPARESDSAASGFQITALDWLPPQGHLETIGGTQLLITAREEADRIEWAIQFDPTAFSRLTIIHLSEMVCEAATNATRALARA